MFFKIFIFFFVFASLFEVCDSWKITQCRDSRNRIYCWWPGDYLHISKATYGRRGKQECSRYRGRMSQIDVTTALQRVCHGENRCDLYGNVEEIFKNVNLEYDGTEPDLHFYVEFKCRGFLPPTPPTLPPPTQAPEHATRILCEGLAAFIGCFDPPTQVLQILSATYGRTNPHSCRSNKLYSKDDGIKCWSDVSKYLKRTCDGRKRCSLSTVQIESDFGNPCKNKQTRKFLEVKFKCVSKVSTTPQIATTKQRTKPTRETTQKTISSTQATQTTTKTTTTTTTTTPPTPPPYLRRTLCEGKGAFIGCFAPGQVIQILNATFGRTDPHSCPSSNPRNDNITCYIDAVPYTKFQCDEKSFCVLSSDPGQYGHACKDRATRSFLDVKYKCVARGSFTPMFVRTTQLIPSVPTAPSSNSTSNSTNFGNCGRPQISVSRVVQGTDAKRGSWPWQIAIYTKNGAFTCGGSIISPQWIVTAAHCFQSSNPSDYYIVVGDNDRKNLTGNELRYSIGKIIIHRMYDTFGAVQHDNDISMVKLSQPIRFGRFVQPVCLPPNQQNITTTRSSSRCFVTGWGKAGQLTSLQTKLQQLQMVKVPKAKCVTKLSNAPGKPGEKITRRMFCATAKKNQNVAGTCQGDSGGPFVCQEANGQWVLNGIVSWGSPRCAPADMYGVFADVSEFVPWINGIRQQN